MTNNPRIEQFRMMADANPNDELAHFSLGNELLKAGDAQGAIASFKRAIEINPKMSKSYQLLAKAQDSAGSRDEAIASLKSGAQIAHDRGDLLPRNEMLEILKGYGVEIPELEAVKEIKVGEGQVLCRRCGSVKPKMPRAPYSNAQGQQIWNNICNECWREWISMGTKVINELRLPLSDPQAQKVYDQHMLEFLNLK